MASSPNLSVSHSRNNPAPTLFGLGLLGRETIVRRRESRVIRTDSLSRFTAGILLGFCGAYVLRSPLTVGQVTILAAFGILLLANTLVDRDRKSETRSSRFASAAIESRLAAPTRNGRDGEKRK